MKKMKAYCIPCKEFKIMKNPRPEKLWISQQMAFIGKCPDCGKEIFTLDKKEYIQQVWGK